MYFEKKIQLTLDHRNYFSRYGTIAYFNQHSISTKTDPPGYISTYCNAWDKEKNIHRLSIFNNFYFVFSYMTVWFYSRMTQVNSEKFQSVCDLHRYFFSIATVPTLNDAKELKKNAIGIWNPPKNVSGNTFATELVWI